MERSQLRGHKQGIYALAFSTGGDLLASGGAAGDVKLWRVDRGNLVWTQPDPFFMVQCLDISPDDRFVAAGGDSDHHPGIGHLTVRNISGGETLHRVTGVPISSVDFSPDGSLLASGGGDHTLKLWRTSDWMLVREIDAHIGSVNSVSFSPDGQILATSGGNTLKLWESPDWSLLRVFEHDPGKGAVSKARFSSDGSLLTSTLESQILVRRTSGWKVTQTFVVDWDLVLAVAVSHDGSLLAASWPAEDWQAQLSIWQIADGSPIRSVQSVSGDVFALAFSPDGALAYPDATKIHLLRTSDIRI